MPTDPRPSPGSFPCFRALPALFLILPFFTLLHELFPPLGLAFFPCGSGPLIQTFVAFSTPSPTPDHAALKGSGLEGSVLS